MEAGDNRIPSKAAFFTSVGLDCALHIEHFTRLSSRLAGHEIHGYENLPRTGGALLVYYHPLVPFDNIYLACDLLRRGERPLGGIMDRLLVKAVPNIAKVSVEGHMKFVK